MGWFDFLMPKARCVDCQNVLDGATVKVASGEICPSCAELRVERERLAEERRRQEEEARQRIASRQRFGG